MLRIRSPKNLNEGTVSNKPCCSKKSDAAANKNKKPPQLPTIPTSSSSSFYLTNNDDFLLLTNLEDDSQPENVSKKTYSRKKSNAAAKNCKKPLKIPAIPNTPSSSLYLTNNDDFVLLTNLEGDHSRSPKKRKSVNNDGFKAPLYPLSEYFHRTSLNSNHDQRRVSISSPETFNGLSQDQSHNDDVDLLMQVDEASLEIDDAKLKEDDITIEEDKATLEEDQAIQEENEVVKEHEKSPQKEDEALLQVGKTLQRVDKGPLQVGDSPLQEDEAPLQKEAPPVKVEAPLIKYEALSQADKTPVQEDLIPLHENEAPLHENEASQRDEEAWKTCDEDTMDSEDELLDLFNEGTKIKQKDIKRRHRSLREDIPLANRLRNRYYSRLRPKAPKPKEPEPDHLPDEVPWKEEEKLRLVQGLKKFGLFNLEDLRSVVQTRSTNQIRKFMEVQKATFRSKKGYRKNKPKICYTMDRTDSTSRDVGVRFHRTRRAVENYLFTKDEEDIWWSSFLEDIESKAGPEYLTERLGQLQRVYRRAALGHALYMVKEFEEHPGLDETGGVDLKAAYHFLWACFTSQPLPELNPRTRSFLVRQYDTLLEAGQVETPLGDFMDNMKWKIDECSRADPLQTEVDEDEPPPKKPGRKPKLKEDSSQIKDYTRRSQTNDKTDSSQIKDYTRRSQTKDKTDSSQIKDYTRKSQTKDKTDSSQIKDKTDSSESQDKADGISQPKDKEDSSQIKDKTGRLQIKDSIDRSQIKVKTKRSQTKDKADSSQTKDKTKRSQTKDKADISQIKDTVDSSVSQDKAGSSSQDKDNTDNSEPKVNADNSETQNRRRNANYYHFLFKHSLDEDMTTDTDPLIQLMSNSVFNPLSIPLEILKK